MLSKKTNFPKSKPAEVVVIFSNENTYQADWKRSTVVKIAITKNTTVSINNIIFFILCCLI